MRASRKELRKEGLDFKDPQLSTVSTHLYYLFHQGGKWINY